MRYFEVEGDSPEEILNQFCLQKSIPREFIEMDIIDPGSKGFLGIGKKPAKVKIKFDEYEYLKRKIRLYIADILNKGNFSEYRLEIIDNKPEFTVNIHSNDSSLLIGRQATTLDSFQYLTDRVMRAEDTEIRAYIDVDSYRDRVVKPLKERAVKLANGVQKNGRSARLSPMATFVRREVHQAVKTVQGVNTISNGRGQIKTITIVSEKKGRQPQGKKPSNRRRRNYNRKKEQ